MKLVILESPTKAKEVAHILGSEYRATATLGHIMDIPRKEMGFSESPEGQIDYRSVKVLPLDDKVAKIADLKKQAKGCDVLVASDPDREGEAIADHVRRSVSREARSIVRVEFHEITPEGVRKGVSNPRKINESRVQAQMARRLVDRIVGYKLTKYAAAALGVERYDEASVGRTQSAALKIVWDRDEEIRNFVPEPFWQIILKDRKDGLDVLFRSANMKTAAEAEAALASLKSAPCSIQEVKPVEKKETPPHPLTASTLQQISNKKFRWAPEKTMKVAQALYEKGDISYMRTDSVRLAPETQLAAREFLAAYYSDCLGEKPAAHKNNSKVQDAHEAIHPTRICPEGEPSALSSSHDSDQTALYDLIWRYFLASQSRPAVWDETKLSCGNDRTPVRLNASGRKLKIPGWRHFFPADKSKGKNAPGADQILPGYSRGETLSGTPETRKDFTKPPSRYSIATLLKALETEGIGRPATYANICSTIQQRRYVEQDDKGFLNATPKGRVMVQWLDDVCREILSKSFTSEMEKNLDEVETGDARMEAVVDEINRLVNRSVKVAAKIPRGAYKKDGVDFSNAPKATYGNAKQPAAAKGKPKTRQVRKTTTRSTSTAGR